MMSDFWEGRPVLVTGAGGFIGSHLTERLASLGANVTAMVHYNALGKQGWLDHSPVQSQVKIIAGDIADRDSVISVMRNCDVVFHLAALIAIPYSYHAPLSYVRTNVEGTLNVLQAARELKVSRVIHTSTSETYGTAQYVPMDEKHPLQGQSPYAASKIGADKMAEAFHLSFGVPVVTVRPFNTFGPRQSARAVIPTIISQCLAGAKTLKLGNTSPTRDMNYVSNTVDGFIAAAQAPKAVGKTFNLGSSSEVSVGELAQRIVKIIGVQIEIETDSIRTRPHGSEVERLFADARLAHELLGWSPAVGLGEGLERTVGWFRQNLQSNNIEYII